ncbi:putative toxin-antitoxin system toxin component, PIN family [Emticicia sp. CRIBPO]|uniref:putative toxin-antitoxin system toxin component, PIN family n=1 Tax=Emticicia sp. CRIBPO TaxID=2683258 RepID=UPI0014132FD6|nr:putative toxin-antitoxin system toxin component, PIN family [Emticicia sp. CRIBPO]NBA84329.1 putative toxin-antitoxin system toxin component, PIN family [Emticicia sp. CRIBPO]
MNIVIDTNDFKSALIGKKHRDKLFSVLANPEIRIYADKTLLEEIREVGYREKFRKYVSLSHVDEYIEVLEYRLTFINSDIQIFDSIDPDDNYLLELAVSSGSEYLITGDKKHLLNLTPFRGIRIVRLQEFLDTQDAEKIT